MLEKVVVGIDGSGASVPLLAWCRKALAGTGASVVVVACHTYRPELGDDANDQLRNELTASAQRFCADLGRDLSCEVSIVDGDPRLALQDTAGERDADLLVVGSRGRSQLTNLMLGSVASYLTHHSPVPILVVR